MLGRAVTFGIRADLTGCSVVPTGSSGSLRGMDCKIPHRRVRDVLLVLLVVLVLTCCTRFGASGSELSSRHQEQNHEGGKAQSYIWYQSQPHRLSGGADGVVGLLKGGGL